MTNEPGPRASSAIRYWAIGFCILIAGVIVGITSASQMRQGGSTRETASSGEATEAFTVSPVSAPRTQRDTPSQTDNVSPAPDALPERTSAAADPPPPAAQAAAPQSAAPSIIGRWKFSQLGGVGDIFLSFDEDGRYRQDTHFSSETGLYVFDESSGTLRLQADGLFSKDQKIWHCHVSRSAMAVLEDDTGAHLMYSRIE
ncbi:MAG TPA: hypothetical protein VFA89_18830 [Terriglobales bacterium]|nr:hypothetical protein [Terriglobales bacterium]